MLSRLLRPGRGFPRVLLGLGLAVAAASVSESPGEEDGQRKRKSRAAYGTAIDRSRELLRRVKVTEEGRGTSYTTTPSMLCGKHTVSRGA